MATSRLIGTDPPLSVGLPEDGKAEVGPVLLPLAGNCGDHFLYQRGRWQNYFLRFSNTSFTTGKMEKAQGQPA